MRIPCLILLYLSGISAQHLLLAGGGLGKDSDFFWKRLIHLAGGKLRAHIGIITAGRENPEEAARHLSEILHGYGALVTWIPVADGEDDSANNAENAKLIGRQSAIFIDDGDPVRLIRLLRNADGTDSLVLQAMRKRFERGIISGSGAGAAVLSGTPIPVSGNSYEALVYGTKPFIETGSRRAQHKRFLGSTYIPLGGFGFLQSWLIEPRFNDQTLHGRMIRLLLDTRSNENALARGIGIDQEMGLAIYRVGSPDEFAEVLGNKGGVTVVNATGAHFQTLPTLDISGVTITFVTEDDKIIFNSDEILTASWKADLQGEEWHVFATSSDDIFSAPQKEGGTPGHFNAVAKRLFDSSLSKRMTSLSWQDSPQLIVEMDRRSSLAFHNDSPTTSKHLISYGHLRVGISQRTDI